MIRVFVLYSDVPEPSAYAQHVELTRRALPGVTMRHGRILGAAQGESDVAYYFEFEFPDRDAWKQARDGLMRSAEDAEGLGVSFKTYFAEIE